MANVEHSALTGSDLHEPKGVAAAAANRVYVSNGSASGSWTTVSNDVLASTAKPFQGQLLHLRASYSNTTNGESLTQSAWNTRVINTAVTNEIASASLTSNQISLPAGTYFIDCHATHEITDGNGALNMGGLLRLRNITAGTTTLVGMRSSAGAGTTTTDLQQHQVIPFLRGRFTLGGTTTLEIQDYPISTSASTHRAGAATSSGESEVYLDACIWKIA